MEKQTYLQAHELMRKIEAINDVQQRFKLTLTNIVDKMIDTHGLEMKQDFFDLDTELSRAINPVFDRYRKENEDKLDAL